MLSGVSAGSTRDFTQDELEAMRREDSSHALNAARRNAGQKGPDVVVRGDDPCLAEKLAKRKSHLSIGESVGAVTHAIDLAEGLGVHATAALGSLGIIGVGVSMMVSTQAALAELQNAKDDLRNAATRDVLHGAMLRSLTLPVDYKQGELTRLGLEPTAQSPVTKIATQLIGTPLGAALQLHCDQGTNAAEDLLRSGKTQAQFFAMCPKLAARHASDPAFRAGFDALVWAHQHAPADRDAMLAGVRQRDARYEAARLDYRV